MSNSSLAASSVPNCLISSSAIVFDVKDGVENLSLNPILSITRRATFNSRPVIVKTFLIPPEILVPKDALNTHVPLLVEVKRLSCQRYRKLNGLVGIILETMSVVFEFQPEGSLRDYILNKKPLPWAARFALAIDVADGMSFLVARQSGQLKKEKCTHQHLSSSNILIVVAKGILRAKITDFGTKSLREAFIDFENVSAERYTKVKRTSMSIPPLQKSLAGNNIPKSESGGFFLQRRNSVYCDQTVDRKVNFE